MILRQTGESALTGPPWSILFHHYTTNASPGCCPDDRPATLRPFLSDSYGPGPRHCSQ